jgi:hypothetical protein
MAFHLPGLNMPLLVVAMGSIVLSAAGQSSDQSIIFSTPTTDNEQAVTPSLSPQNSQTPVLPDSLQAPDPALHFQTPYHFPAGPPAEAITPQAQQMRKLMEERKNWTLMTPAEILGVTPTDALLQPPERDAMGRPKNPTQLERYLDRQNQPRGGLTNGWQNDRDNSPWQFSRDRNNLNTSDPGRDSTMAAAQRLNEYLKSRRIGDDPLNRNNKNLGWNFFKTPAPQMMTKPDLEQMAAMDRFRQLLDPSRAPATESSPDNKFSTVPQTTPVLDPYITQPAYVPNPAGASFTPLTNDIGRPTGLTPLPGIVAPTMAPVAPAWAPQPAPWLSQIPQPFMMPQRKF